MQAAYWRVSWSWVLGEEGDSGKKGLVNRRQGPELVLERSQAFHRHREGWLEEREGASAVVRKCPGKALLGSSAPEPRSLCVNKFPASSTAASFCLKYVSSERQLSSVV